MFDTSSKDSQGTIVAPLAPELFDIEAYADYSAKQNQRIKEFNNAESGVLVYRRFRVPEVYSYGSRDMKQSLSLQLGALTESINFKADFANFLEPWYGIGTAASAFGFDYTWIDGQAPVIHPAFSSIQDFFKADITPVEKTEIGKKTLAYINYFLEKTKGKIPVSFSDIQAPNNAASLLIPVDKFFLEMVDYPEEYEKLMMLFADLTVDFLLKQKELLGDVLVYPGHGFASSHELKGIGVSDDNSIMITNRMFDKLEAPVRERMGKPFGGIAYHSCGNWEKKIPSVLKIKNVVCADGAFTPETDPAPNSPEPFGKAFAKTGINLHIRTVGSPDEIADTVKRIWQPGLRLIVCTYCQTAEEQAMVYDRIHEICQ